MIPMSQRRRQAQYQHSSRQASMRMAHCDFLQKLPLEIRHHIYRYLLICKTLFSPIVLSRRGTLAILGVNRQIREEAIQFVHDHNRIWVRHPILCARNPVTPLNLQAPVQTDLVKHLLISGWLYTDGGRHKPRLECEMCVMHSPQVLLNRLKAFSELRTVVVACGQTRHQMMRFRESVAKSDEFNLVNIYPDDDRCFSLAQRLQGPGMRGIKISFQYSPCGLAWPRYEGIEVGWESR